MALVLSTAGKLKSEIRLAQAVSEFEATLSDSDKQALRTQKVHDLAAPPDSNDVMRLTAQIDRSQKPGRRCYGPRFTKFLHGAQQFAALGDVIVGGSQNIIACGVWSLIRMSLLAVVNFSTYMENLSMLLMEAGRSTPQHFELAVLYPRSRELQSYVNEYFISVVELCHKFYSYTQKRGLQKLTSSLNDTDVKELQSRLVARSNSIKGEINVLSTRTTEEEAQKNTIFRGVMTKWSTAASRQYKLGVNKRCLDSISEYDYETTWRQIRKEGNTNTYSMIPAYSQWKQRQQSGTLVLTGTLGCGKSVMLANMTEILILQTEAAKCTVAYFFCRHDVCESLRSDTIIAALVYQAIRPFVDTCDDLEGILKNLRVRDPFNYLAGALFRVLPENHRVYFVLDGLDLCHLSEQIRVAEQIQQLQAGLLLLTCISRRLEPGVEQGPFLKHFPSAELMAFPDNSSEIAAFTTAELQRCATNGLLVTGDAHLIQDIHDALLKGSQGMFLWVAIQIKTLCSMQTDAEIREALDDLPRDLSEVYSRILLRSERPGKSYQERVFKLVLAAGRPLTVYEMREALSVTPGDTEWDDSKLLNDVNQVLATCGGLVTVDEEENTVRTVHSSVNLFLLDDSSPDGMEKSTGDKIHAFTVDAAHTLMVSVILTYLRYSIFETQLAIRDQRVEIGQAPLKVMQSTIAGSRGLQRHALKILPSRKQTNFDASSAIKQNLGAKRPPKATKFHFQEYARSHALAHCLKVSKLDVDDREGLEILLHRDIIRLNHRKVICDAIELAIQYHLDYIIHIVGLNGCFVAAYEAYELGHDWGLAALFQTAIKKEAVLTVHAFCHWVDQIYSEGKFSENMADKTTAPFLRNPLNNRSFDGEFLLGSNPVVFALQAQQPQLASALVREKYISIDVNGSSWLDKPIVVATEVCSVDTVRNILEHPKFQISDAELKLLIDDAQSFAPKTVARLLKKYRNKRSGKSRSRSRPRS